MTDTTKVLDLEAPFSTEAAGTENPDHALACGLRAGREAAYEELIQRYQQPVFNLVCRLMGDYAAAPDVVQDVFVKIFRSIGHFRGNSSLKTWIYRIAVNEAHNHRRWLTRHSRQEIGLASGDELGIHEQKLTDPGRNPFEVACDHETRALVEEALQSLNPKFHEAVILRDIEDLSYEEIASVLEVSIGTVKSRILRGREALRNCLEGRLALGGSFEFAPQTAQAFRH